MTRCSRSTCFAPQTTCDLGFLDWSKCPTWKGRDEASGSPGEAATDELLLPWSGSALGLADLGFLAGGRKPLVVGIAGPENAGKTTLLAAWYLLVGRGLAGSEKRRFAGSYSLAGWEAVASALHWTPGQQPSFPPHTSSRGGRAPGLLHLAFRNADGQARGYLFTDAPGEWFQKWAVNRDALDGEGARWMAEHADVFLLIADREALSGPNMGSARGSLQLLARRLAAERAARKVALVWTKSDVSVAPEMEKAVREAVLGLMPGAVEFSVSILPSAEGAPDKGRGLIELLDWTLDVRRERLSLPPVTAPSADPLFMFGARWP
jgi:Double-GTPase 2